MKDIKKKDYFVYVELDDYECWILADGLDTDKDKCRNCGGEYYLMVY